jgi:hypothetical protein
MRPLHRFLGSSEAASALLAQLARKERLAERVRARLPADLAGQCRQVSLDDACLILVTTSPVWSTRLRFLLPQIIADLNADGLSVHRGDIRVAPLALAEVKTSGRVLPALSPRASECLRQAAEAVSDPALAAGLRRLASRGADDASSSAS